MRDHVRAEDLPWASSYHGYDRLASDPGVLGHLLDPARRAFERTGTVPEWCGVDLLRGWAFYLYRADYFEGGGTLGREWEAVLEAVRNHPAARREDMPPP